MIEPKIDDLLATVDSKYTLVILSAKRAREINSYYSQLGEGRGEFVPPLVETGLRNKPLSIALEEIAEGKIALRASRGDRRGRLTCPSHAAAGCCSGSPVASPRTRPPSLARGCCPMPAPEVTAVLTDVRDAVRRRRYVLGADGSTRATRPSGTGRARSSTSVSRTRTMLRSSRRPRRT